MHLKQDKTAEIEYQDLIKKGLPDETFSDKIYEKFFEIASLHNCRKSYILDAGCGVGNFGRRLAQKGHEVVGVDISARVVDKANGYGSKGFRAMKGDLEDKNLFREGTFDIVFFGQVLHHFPDINRVVENCSYWLKDTGLVIAIEPNGSNPINKIGRQIGLFLSKNKKWAYHIATPNEVSISHKQLIKILEKNKMEIEFLRTYSVFFEIDLSHVRSVFLRFLINLRDCLYWITWRILPEEYRGRTMIVKAFKKGISNGKK